MAELTDAEQVVLIPLVRTAQDLVNRGDDAAFKEWLEGLNGHECALLLTWAVDHWSWRADPVEPGALERSVGQGL